MIPNDGEGEEEEEMQHARCFRQKTMLPLFSRGLVGGRRVEGGQVGSVGEWE